MNQTTRLTPSLLLAAGLSLAPFQANGAAIQIDFGSQITPTTTGSQNLGAFGAAKADGYATGTYWNVTPNTGAMPALFNDANAAAGVTLTMGNLTNAFNLPGLLATAEAGNASITRDFLYSVSSLPLTATFTGLQAATYDIYVMIGNNGSVADGSRTWNVGFTVGGTLQTTLPIGPLTGNDNTIWNAGINYVKYQATLADGESLLISSAPVGHDFGVFNAIQIVPVPEPSTGLMGVLAGLGLCFRRRRHHA